MSNEVDQEALVQELRKTPSLICQRGQDQRMSLSLLDIELSMEV